jgi:DNA polymerase III subunit gamma/tau
VWDIKYRPLRFEDVLGQEGTIQVLKSRLKNGTALDTSYILAGNYGMGKTTLARILSRALLCQDLQEGEPCNECDNCRGILSDTSMAFAELDAASRGTIDNVRKIIEDLDFAVRGASKRVYVFDEIHRMSRDAQDVLLKPIEDKKLVGIFCTTEPSKIRGTIRSRCEEHLIRKITREDILARVRGILEKEEVHFEDDAVLTVIDHCGGHVRDVLNRLETIAQLGDVDIETVRTHLELGLVTTYYQILLSLGNPTGAISLVEMACDRVGVEEVSSGLAEAAMNSYRLAHNMFTEYTYVDKPLAEQVYSIYGDSVIHLAEYFLKRRPSKINLICDVVLCAAGVPSRQVTATPVKIMLQAPEEPIITAEVVASVDPIRPILETAKPISETAKPISETAKPISETAKSIDVRNDGIGNLGSSDPLALTSDDRSFVPIEYPRGSRQDPPLPKFEGKYGRSSAERLLTTKEWAHRFRNTWSSRG